MSDQIVATALPSVAIVILNWNGRHFLEKFLPSVMRSRYENKRVIVADNASSDDSLEFLIAHFPAVEIIKNAQNFGFSKGYNEALKQVRADYYVLLNSDVEVDENWLLPVITLMESNPLIAACQPKILSYENKHLFEYAGASGGWIDNFGYPFMRGRVFETCETDKGQYDKTSSCFWASGAALFVRPSVYHMVKGMDEYFFAHQEEIDLCWRMQLAGFKIYVEPGSKVYHVGGGSLPKGNRKVYLNFRNNLVMLYKNLPAREIVLKVPLRLVLDGIAAWKGLFAGDAGYFVAVCRAHVGFVKWLLFHKKGLSQKPQPPKLLNGWYHGSIVWQYYAKGKKSFSQIVESK